MLCGIYKITNNINGKKYIGQSVDIERRWKSYKRHKKCDYPIYRAFKKYGIENFTFSIICLVPENSLNVYETSYIRYYDTTNSNNGYNLLSGGGAGGKHSQITKDKIASSMTGKMHSEKTKAKISNAIKGIKFSEEHCRKFSDGKLGAKNPWYNKNLPAETRNKISQALTGKSLTEERKNKISQALTGRKLSIETRTKMSNAKRKSNKE